MNKLSGTFRMLLVRAFLLFLGVAYWVGTVEACSTDTLVANLVSLLQTAFRNAGSQGSENPTVSIVQHQVVCLTTTTTRGTYSSASVVVSFTCSGVACPGTGNTQQFEFTCGSSSSNMWSPTSFAVPSGGSLTTPLRTDCGLCIQSAGGLSSRFDNATHCVACSSLCNVGLMECTGISNTDCCNGVVNNMCVDNCTAPARPLDSANYECTEFCDPLTDPDNGDITFSSGVLVGSVATYVCDANFAVQGGVNRTCEVNGTTTMWSAAASSCVRVATEGGPTQDTTGLKITMTPPETTGGNSLGIGAIIGIVIAIIIVLLIVAVVIVAVICIARK